jgi:ABC-type nitrate/sulfonate/bicarbonate transport system permease component
MGDGGRRRLLPRNQFPHAAGALYYDLPTIFVSLITIGILGLIMDRLVQAERHHQWRSAQ